MPTMYQKPDCKKQTKQKQVRQPNTSFLIVLFGFILCFFRNHFYRKKIALLSGKQPHRLGKVLRVCFAAGFLYMGDACFYK